MSPELSHLVVTWQYLPDFIRKKILALASRFKQSDQLN